MKDIIHEDWNRMAAAYEAFNAGPDSYSRCIEWPCVRKLLPDLAGGRVLDLGCGTGIFSFLLEDAGAADVVGLDLSESMLAIANEKAKARASRVTFLQGNAADPEASVRAPFDLVFSSTTSHYLENLNGFFQGTARLLRPGGTCVLSVIHPVYSAMYPVRRGDAFPDDADWQLRYLDRSPRAYVQPWIEFNDDCENFLSVSFHHSFADYVNAALQAGLRLCEVREPLPPERWKQECPERYDSYIETPTFLLLKFEK